MKQNQGPSLIETLNKKDFDRAFYYMFILNTTPCPIEEKIAPGWTEFYNERKENMTCVSCKAGMPYDQAFAANCSHFYCTVCASFLSSGKDGKPDSWFLFDSHKRNPVTKVQEPVPEMSHISPQTYKILHKNA